MSAPLYARYIPPRKKKHDELSAAIPIRGNKDNRRNNASADALNQKALLTCPVTKGTSVEKRRKNSQAGEEPVKKKKIKISPDVEESENVDAPAKYNSILSKFQKSAQISESIKRDAPGDEPSDDKIGSNEHGGTDGMNYFARKLSE